MGKDVVSPAQAWGVYDEWRTDDRVVFLTERAGFSDRWRLLGQQIEESSNVWTDAYLAVFAGDNNAAVVTLDRTFRAIGTAAVKSLA